MNPYKVVYSGDWNFSDSKDCPFCGEKIKMAAIKCKYCLSLLDAKDKAEPSVREQASNNSSNYKVHPFQMLLEELLKNVVSAYGHIGLKNISEKSAVISHARRLVFDLKNTLDLKNDIDLENDMNAFYGFIMQNLHLAEVHNDVEALSELYRGILDWSNALKELTLQNSDSENSKIKLSPQHTPNQELDTNKSSELKVIMDAIHSTDSRMEAAAKLGISPRTLRYKLAQMRTRGMTDLQY